MSRLNAIAGFAALIALLMLWRSLATPNEDTSNSGHPSSAHKLDQELSTAHRSMIGNSGCAAQILPRRAGTIHFLNRHGVNQLTYSVGSRATRFGALTTRMLALTPFCSNPLPPRSHMRFGDRRRMRDWSRAASRVTRIHRSLIRCNIATRCRRVSWPTVSAARRVMAMQRLGSIRTATGRPARATRPDIRGME